MYYFRKEHLQFIGSFYRHSARLQNGALRQPASESVRIRIGTIVPDPSLRIIILFIFTYIIISDSAFPLVLPLLTGQQSTQCRSVIRTLHEKHMEFTRLNKYEEKEENIKIYVTCIGQDSNLAPPCKQTQTLSRC